MVGMMSRRVIQVIGTIDEEAFKVFSERMDELEIIDLSSIIHVELSSGGGSAYDAIAFYERIRLSPCDVHVVAIGYVASAAVLVLAAGDHRKMTENSWVMVHEDSGKLKGNTVELEREAKHMRRLETQWTNLLQSRTKKSSSSWGTMHKNTTYLNAHECKALGLVDEVI